MTNGTEANSVATISKTMRWRYGRRVTRTVVDEMSNAQSAAGAFRQLCDHSKAYERPSKQVIGVLQNYSEPKTL